jgi:hypothetical protein
MASVHGAALHSALGKVFHRIFDGLRHIEKLQVDEYFFALRMQHVHQVPVALRHEQLKTQLVK